MMYSDDAAVINDLSFKLGRAIETLQAIENACILYLQLTVKGVSLTEEEIKRLVFIRDLATDTLKKEEVR